MNIDTLLPELIGQSMVVTREGFALVRLPKNCVAIFTREELKRALGRGKAVIRSRALHQRLQTETE